MRFGLRLRFWAFSHQESIETRDLKRTRRITYLGCVRGPGGIGLSQSTNGPIPEYRAIWKPRVELLELLGAPTPDDQSAQTRRE